MCEEKQNTRCSFELISFHHFLSLSCSNAFMSWYQILWFNKVKPFLQNVNKVWKDYSLHYRHDMRWLFLKSLQLEFRSLIFAPFSACISLSYFLTMNLYAHFCPKVVFSFYHYYFYFLPTKQKKTICCIIQTLPLHLWTFVSYGWIRIQTIVTIF